MPKQLGFLIDLNKCIGCHSCEFACKNENRLEEISFRRVLDLKQRGNVFAYLSLACNHCANPQCIRVCPEKCFRKLRNGIVLYDYVRCDGCQRCIGACPFKVPKYDPFTKKVNKCNLCYKRIRQGLKPACVSACIPEALQIINFNEPLPANCKKTIPSFAFIPLTNPSVRFLLPKETICFWLEDKEE
ncbi:MAG: 4Fe-4S dicluster domain-containing protein [Peptococcaceae bacterium]|nr:4Fe-4S dicluster domain-containing protein [Peptococcaceae bacterium]